MEQAVSVGEALLDLLISFKNQKPFSLVSPGGSAANMALGLSRLGIKVKMVGSVGDDEVGKFLLDFLAKNGVDVSNVIVKKGVRTSYVIVNIKENGEREFIGFSNPWSSYAVPLISVKDVNIDDLLHNDLFITTGVALGQDPMRSLALSIIRGAYEKGKVTILDPNIRLEIWDSIEELKRVMFNAMRHTTAFLASIDEASLLTSLSSPRDIGIHLVRNFNISLAALKMGKDGAYVFTNEGEEVQMKAFDVKIIDTTGAGDAWNAGFIYSYYFKGEGLKESVKFANAVAGLKCRDYGAMYPLPTLEEVKRFLSENK